MLPKKAAAAFGQLHTLVVGQVDGDGLGARVAVAGIVDHVVYVDVAVGAGHFFLILGVAGEELLHLGQEGGELAEVVAPGLVLDEHESFVAALETVDAVVVVLDGADHEVELAVFHVHPHHVAVEVVVGAEGFAAGLEVFLEAGVVGQGDGLLEQAVDFGQLGLVGLVVGQYVELAVLVAAQHAVLVVLQRVFEGLKLFGRHVDGVEVAAGVALAVAGQEGALAVEAVPGAVLDAGEGAHGGVAQGVDALAVGVAEVFVPVDVVHHLAYLDEYLHQLFLVGREGLDEVGGEGELGILVHFLLDFGVGSAVFACLFVLASDGQEH